MGRPGAQDSDESGARFDPAAGTARGRAHVPAAPTHPQSQQSSRPPSVAHPGTHRPPWAIGATPPAAGRASVVSGSSAVPVNHPTSPTPARPHTPSDAGSRQPSTVRESSSVPGREPSRVLERRSPAVRGAGSPAAPARKSSRRRLLWVSSGLVLVVLTGGGLLATHSDEVESLLGHPTATTTTPSPPPPAPVLGDLAGTALPTAEGLTRAIDGLAGDPQVGALAASIMDVASGETLYDRDSGMPKVPASVNKLVTAAAVLAVRGPSHRLVTRAVVGSEPGEVVLVGAGDPTLAVDAGDTYQGAARLDKLAEQVTRNLGATKPLRVLVDSSVFTGAALGPGWDSDIALYGYGAPITGLMINGGRAYPKRQAPRSRQPDLAAGLAFAKLLGVPPSAVKVGQAAQGATELGVVRSLSVLRLVEIMLRDSDNVVAEALARQVALGRDAEASFSGAAQATREVLEELRLPTDQIQLADGSGLSRKNRLTTALLTTLLARAASDDNAELSGVFSGLPVAGYSGTLHDRFAGESDTAAGLVRAKTGTLNGVSALAGVVPDADGRLLSFSLIANGVPGGADAAEVVLDRIAAALAGCGCR